jgi:hypothetical protein
MPMIVEAQKAVCDAKRIDRLSGACCGSRRSL